MDFLYLDFESRSCLDLSVVGQDRYMKHESTEVLMLAHAINDDPVELWEPRLGKMPSHLTDALHDWDVIKVAWNASFERNMFRHKLGLWIPYDEWEDPSIQAKQMSMSGSLEEVSEIIGLGQEGKLDGDDLKDMFCTPVDPGGKQTLFGVSKPVWRDWNTHPLEWTKFQEYCRRDVVAERVLHKTLLPLPEIEKRGWYLDQKINDRGIPVDMEVVRGGLKVAEAAKRELSEKLHALTGVDNPNSRDQMLAWLKTQGYTFGALEKGLVNRALNGECKLTDAAREALNLRRQLAKTSDSKFEAIQNIVSEDHRVRHQFNFMGASRTGRWCLAEGSPVTVKTAAGVVVEKPIQDVSLTDLLWDGLGWVSHDGVVFSGDKDTIEWEGIEATREHVVWTSPTDKTTLGEAKGVKKLWKPVVYRIYRLTSPSGRFYIGLTKLALKDRWRSHVRRAKTTVTNHPLYNSIRKYGPDSFTIEVIDLAPTKEDAQLLEKAHIALSDPKKLYNISPGGEADGEAGSKVFWDRINADPAARAVYIQKLSDTKKKNDWSDYSMLTERHLQWRKDNAREAYKKSYRAIRIAAKAQKRTPRPPDTRPLKERLMWKHRRGVKTQENALALWARRTAEEKREVGNKISSAQKARSAAVPVEQRKELMARVRSHVDRKKQGAAASRGLKKFWEDLKKDPVAYAAYMKAKTKSLLATLEAVQ